MNVINTSSNQNIVEVHPPFYSLTAILLCPYNEISLVRTKPVPLERTRWELSFEWSHPWVSFNSSRLWSFLLFAFGSEAVSDSNFLCFILVCFLKKGRNSVTRPASSGMAWTKLMIQELRYFNYWRHQYRFSRVDRVNLTTCFDINQLSTIGLRSDQSITILSPHRASSGTKTLLHF